MIQAKDLRIGNWLYMVDPEDDPTHVLHVLKYVDPVLDAFYEPIPLTPELLEKAGFKEFGMWYLKKPFDTTEGNFLLEKVEGQFKYEHRNIVVKHVHQLQNLYYALTGEELQVNMEQNHQRSAATKPHSINSAW